MAYVGKQSIEENNLKPVFPHQFLIKCSEETCDILVCSKSLTNRSFEDWKKKSKRLERSSKNNLDLSDYFDDMLHIS